MKNFFYLFIAIFSFIEFLPTHGLAQFQKQGIAVKNVSNFKVGDTVQVLGIHANNNKYLIKDMYGKSFVNPNRIELIQSDKVDYWEELWFKNRAADIASSGWDNEVRDILNEEANEYYQNALQSNIVYEEELLNDYLSQIILDIHPKPLNKGMHKHFKLVIIKSAIAESFTFENGMIILTSGLLSNLESKSDLVHLLTTHIAHLVLEHNLENLKKEIKSENRAIIFSNLATVVAAAGSAYAAIEHDIYLDPYLPQDVGLATYFVSKSLMSSAGANYSHIQVNKAWEAKKNFLIDSEDLTWHNEPEFHAYMAPVISLTAWQEYHMKNYSRSISLVEKLHKNQLAMEEDYLLFSKLLRNTSNSEQSNLKALEYLVIAQKMSKTLLIDLDKEAALIYLRMKDKENAEIALKNYKSGLNDLNKKGIDISKELATVNQLAHHHQLSLSDVASY